MSAQREIRVDEWQCAGHARCEEVAPEIYEVNDDGVAVVLIEPDTEELWAKAEEGAEACPVQAILLGAQNGPAAS